MSKQLFVILRNTESGIAREYTPEEAERILAHPIFGRVNEEVRTAKPEVLHHGTEARKIENKSKADSGSTKEEKK